MAEQHSVKRGDAKTLKWNLGRDLSAATSARVIIAAAVGATPAIDRDGVIESPASDGIVSLELDPATDYAAGKLELTADGGRRQYLVEIEVQPGPLTHPDTVANAFGTLTVLPDLA